MDGFGLIEETDRIFDRGGTEMHVPLRRGEILMPGELLNRSTRCAAHRQMRTECVAEFATVFYDRIKEQAPTLNAEDIACMLGHVIAHEIGHLLPPRKEHSRSGIMQAELNTQLAAEGGLLFTPSQAQLIWKALSDR